MLAQTTKPESWMLALGEAFDIMIEAEEKRYLSLENYQALFGLNEEIQAAIGSFQLINGWAFKFMYQFANP